MQFSWFARSTSLSIIQRCLRQTWPTFWTVLRQLFISVPTGGTAGPTAKRVTAMSSLGKYPTSRRARMTQSDPRLCKNREPSWLMKVSSLQSRSSLRFAGPTNSMSTSVKTRWFSDLVQRPDHSWHLAYTWAPLSRVQSVRTTRSMLAIYRRIWK